MQKNLKRNGNPLHDFYSLNLQTLDWTTIENVGFQEGIHGHTLTKVSAREILVIGGQLSSQEVSHQVKVFHVDDQEWRDETPLPNEITQHQGQGLFMHKAVPAPKENGIFIYCIGGFIDRDKEKHPNFMAILDVHC